jgi:filamentous hemagglutinin family protein
MKTITNLTMLSFRVKRTPALTLALALFVSSLAQAAPVGGVVGAGTASIDSSGSNTTINQSTPKAIINWQGFNVGANESVRFNQPSSSAITLNRVIGADGSRIMGNLSANGRVFLINPNGILFGAGSQVNVGGMVASTLGMTDANFLAGNYRFTGNSAASISNQGNIATNIDGGYIALLGANVSNTGVITARLGTVALAAGNGLTLDVAGDRLLNINVDQGAINALVSNGHLIMADGGQVLMTARGASNLLSNAVNNTGLIQAQSINNSNGSIVLSAGPDAGVVNVGGSLDASGTATGQTGGLVHLLGGTINLNSANINVSGDAGGGQALVGGNFNGAGPQANALFTNIDSASTINADALRTGNGGQIAVWSDNSTVMAGTLTARGGALSGDGGFIETSGKNLIITNTAYINTLAVNGKAGMWLLDPINWVIATTGGDETPAQVTTSLASSDRTITATNDITVSDAITWSTPQDLTLNAGHDVNINAAITASTAGAQINMTAGNDVSIVGALTASGFGNQINVTSTSGNITATGEITASAASTELNMTSGNNLTVGTVTTDGGGSMNLRAKGNVSVGTASAAASPGTVTLYADSDGSGVGTVIIGSTITATNTTVRFNPATYATTSTEVNSYTAKITGSEDVKAWVFLQGNNKVYDQSTADTLSFKGAPTQASAVTLVAGTANFADKNAGVDKAVTYSGYSLGGTSSDLVLYSASGTTTATITPASLVVSASGINKVYDGTTSDTVTLYANPIAGDVVNPSYTSASFSTPYVGSNKPVSVLGISLTGADAGNYSYNTTASTTASITSNGTPNPTASVASLEVAPTSPPGVSVQSPKSLQEDVRSGAATPTVVPIVAYDNGVTSESATPITAYGIGAGGLIIGSQGANQSNLLVVANPQRGPEMQSLFPAPVIAPMPPIVPILVPKQGRN